jgi:hypothetical protein
MASCVRKKKRVFVLSYQGTGRTFRGFFTVVSRVFKRLVGSEVWSTCERMDFDLFLAYLKIRVDYRF